MIKAIVFDFDGVIAESVDVKTEAFRDIYKDCPDIQDMVTTYHIENGGISRVKKFEYYEKELLHRELTQEKLDQLCGQFHDLVVEKVIKAPFVKGAREILDEYFEKCFCFVASGTPDNEIKEIVEKRGLNKYFHEVCGSPESKASIVKRIKEKYSLKDDEVIFIGDARSDLNAAKKTGALFIARLTDHDHDWYQDPYIKHKFRDLVGVGQLLKELII